MPDDFRFSGALAAGVAVGVAVLLEADADFLDVDLEKKSLAAADWVEGFVSGLACGAMGLGSVSAAGVGFATGFRTGRAAATGRWTVRRRTPLLMMVP
jgi:hypothetical protein